MASKPDPRSEPLKRRGLMFVLSSPSGAGKTTISRKLLEADPQIRMSVSATTRPMRPGEVDGRDYHFIARADFDRMVAQDQFLEWAEVFGNCYGTPRAQIAQGLETGQDYLFDIDWQGTQQLSERMAGDLVRVFVLPPSGPVLEERLRRRAQDSDEVVALRMAQASGEISHWAEYDYVIVNHDLAESSRALKSILAAERLRRDRMSGLSAFVRGLQAALS